MQVIFEKTLKNIILDAFNVTANEDGLLVEKNNTRQKVLTKNGRDVEIDRFAGITKGSEIYIRNDIISLIQYCEDKR